LLLAGNDIVDLSHHSTHEKWRDHRFVARVCSADEQQCIQSASDPNLTLWKIWSAKETLFKIVSKLQTPPVFSHKKFIITLLDGNRMAHATYHDCTIEVQFIVKNNVLHAGAVSSTTGAPSSMHYHMALAPLPPNLPEDMEKLDDFTEWERESLHKWESVVVRRQLKEELRQRLGVKLSDLQIIRPQVSHKSCPPYVVLHGARIPNIDISLSHHGKWVGWALVIIPFDNIENSQPQKHSSQ